MRRFFFLIFVLITLSLGAGSLARGQSQIEVNILQVESIFGEQISMQAEFISENPIVGVQVFIQSLSLAPSLIDQTSFISPNQIHFTIDLNDHPIQVFSQIDYWFQFELENGDFLTSEIFNFDYTDNRFEWQSLITDEFEIFWYQGDQDFGELVLSVTYEGLARIREIVQVPQPEKVKFYIYASSEELQKTLRDAGELTNQIAGHSNSILGVIVVSIPPDTSQILEIKRQIPHELSHILLYKKLGNGYVNLPQWLSEGVASAAELLPNPNYPILLNRAYDRDALIAISELCIHFPSDAANYQLAYAQAASFTWFLHDLYGSEKMESLLASYAAGLDCGQGVSQVYASSLSQLEQSWRQNQFHENPILALLIEIAPWLILLAAILVPIIILSLGGRTKKG
ncbi:MAG: hypothetical protein IZT55_03865 [Anaerolineae bacterium]|nr:hypothetical protein [Anaerolineae bacterium]